MTEGLLTGEPAVIGQENRLSVNQCAACDSRHDGLLVQQYQRPIPPFTHWYTCPTLGDPVGISLAMMKDSQVLELHGPVMQALAQAQVSGRFMVVVWSYDEHGRLRIDTVSRHKFPVVDYFPDKDHRNALGMLDDLLRQEVGQITNTEPMRPAGALRPLVNLRGKANGDVEQFKVSFPHELPPVVSKDSTPEGADNGNGAE